ncbi:uncharacterized protein LOC119585597 isoform X2 [Penaeus monodon]|uniref:uncharacterized protein LOC119585597 isoform X2 n=1 Tax=Penaeus monodon TaxID=6687 RepID=UPI0018A74303|nr:uncharacterized protein LOC119585597 isoform X2 [Penaeus monodon]
MQSHLEARFGMAWLVMMAMMTSLVGIAHGDAGHFFAETPKHLPRIGRRGDLPPLATLMIEEDTRGYGRSVGGVPEALARVDADGDGCVSIPELLRVPVIRIAILLQNPALIFEEAPASTEDKSSGTSYSSDRRPEPHLLHYLQK